MEDWETVGKTIVLHAIAVLRELGIQPIHIHYLLGHADREITFGANEDPYERFVYEGKAYAAAWGKPPRAPAS
jgi:hypothetical protein